MTKIALLAVCLLQLLAVAALAAQRTYANRFQNALNYYRAVTAQGADANERIYILDRIFRKYRGDRYALQLIQLKVERNFLAEWKAYSRKVKAGADAATRQTILASLRADYLNTGIDLSMLDRELARLPQQQPVTPQAAPPATVSTITVHEDIVPSSFTVTASTITPPAMPLLMSLPSSPPSENVKRTAKFFGAGAGALGKYGLYGYEAIINFTDRFSFSAGYGVNTLLETPNALSSARQETYSGLLRYGGNVYAATGLLRRVCSGRAVTGSGQASGAITAQGIPLIVGVETGNKRGIFFTLECGYTFYSGPASRTLTATDPASNETAQLKLERPVNGSWFGFGLGMYFL